MCTVMPRDSSIALRFASNDGGSPARDYTSKYMANSYG